MKLIKLKEGYVIVSDEKLQVGDKQLLPNIGKITTIWDSIDSDKGFVAFLESKKVVASTFHPELPKIDFSDLSEENCKRIEWFDLEQIYKEPKVSVGLNSQVIDAYLDGHFYGYEAGFQKALELLSDRRFTGEDLANYLNYVEDNYHYHSDTWHDRDTDEPITRAAIFFKFISQPKSWDIEVEVLYSKTYVDDSDAYGYDIKLPKITNNKIKITKVL